MPKPQQTREAFEAVRQRMIAAARELNSIEGPDAVTLRNVARHSGYSPASMYRYFTDAEDLFRSAWADTVERLGACMAGARKPEDPPLRRIEAQMRAVGAFAESDMVAFRTTFFLLIRKPGPGTRIYDDYLAQTPFALLLADVQEGIDAGDIAAGNPNMIAQTLWGFMHGVLALDQTVSDFPFLDRKMRFDHAVRVALAGIARAPNGTI